MTDFHFASFRFRQKKKKEKKKKNLFQRIFANEIWLIKGYHEYIKIDETKPRFVFIPVEF